MQEPLSYRHRTITEDDLAFIRKLIAEHPGLSRWKLSKKLCEAWNWVQANGAMRDMVCRSMMLMLHRRGLIELPAVRRVPGWSSASRLPAWRCSRRRCRLTSRISRPVYPSVGRTSRAPPLVERLATHGESQTGEIAFSPVRADTPRDYAGGFTLSFAALFPRCTRRGSALPA